VIEILTFSCPPEQPVGGVGVGGVGVGAVGGVGVLLQKSGLVVDSAQMFDLIQSHFKDQNKVQVRIHNSTCSDKSL
jgi:hypothetical protein